PWDRAREMAARTPPTRNRFVDYLRALSIGVVVLGHWLIAVITVDEGRIVAGHLLSEAPVTQWLTWVFQVMPVFFIVGAYSNGASWSAAARAGKSYADWLRGRCQRLLGPTAIFALAWVPLALFAQRWVSDPATLVVATRLVTVPLWFLAVYLAVIPLAPLMLALHHRFGTAVPITLVAGAVVVDALAAARGIQGGSLEPSWSWINYVFVWLAIHQLGFFWWDGSLERSSWIRWGFTFGGLGVLILVTSLGLYPVSMIGVPGAERSNNTPPSAALVLLALFQLGVILLANPAANRRLARTGPWARTIVANGVIMTLYLWHMTAMVLVVFAAFVVGFGLDIQPLTGLWWISRLAWLAVLAATLVVFVAVFGRFERPRPPAEVGRGWKTATLTCVGALMAGAGLAGLAVQGFYTPNEIWGIPVVTLLVLIVGAAAVGVTPRIYMRESSPK
ncbi:MAG: acyltransferase, partial [Acidobacteriota bacterium]|nr:acyltransferase [Acidobacteriota bacterium]